MDEAVQSAGEASAADVLLAVEVGNTETRLGLFCGDELAASWSITTPPSLTVDEAWLALRQFFAACGRVGANGAMHASGVVGDVVDGHAGCAADKQVGSETGATGDMPGAESGGARPTCPCPQDAIVSSVVPSLTDVWAAAARRTCGRRALVVGPGLKTGLKMRCDDPGEVGSDRVANLVAAKVLVGAPATVVDLGTTTNLEVLDADGAFVGGVIAPGLRLSLKALAQAAARLPEVEVQAPARVIGRNTREAMQVGAVLGEAARIDGLLDLVWRDLGCETPVVLTGNDARELTALLRHDAMVDDSLTLRGLCLLHRMNRKR